MRPSGASVPVPGDDRDLAALQQRLEAADEPVDDRLLAHLRLGELDRRRRRVHAELGRAPHRAQHLGGLQQLLGRDAAAVQAGAAEPLLLDDRDAHARRRAVERGRVAARTTAEHDEIEVVGTSISSGKAPTSLGRQLRTSCTANAARITKTGEPREDDVRARAHAARLAMSPRARFATADRGCVASAPTPTGTMSRFVAERVQRMVGDGAQAALPRGHVRGRRGHRHRRPDRVRASRSSRTASSRRRTRRSTTARCSASGSIVFIAHARLLPAARAGGRARARAPAGAGHRRRTAREAGRDARRRSSRSPRSSAAVAAIEPDHRPASSTTTSLLFVVAAHRHRRVLRRRTSRAARWRATAASAPYGTMLGAEGIVRLVATARARSSSASRTPGPYGLALALPPVAAMLIALRGQKRPARARPGRAVLRALDRARVPPARLGALPGALVLARTSPPSRSRRHAQANARRQVRHRHPDRAHPDPRLPGRAGRAAPQARPPRGRGQATTSSARRCARLVMIVLAVGHRRRGRQLRRRPRAPAAAVRHEVHARQPRPRSARGRQRRRSSSPSRSPRR